MKKLSVIALSLNVILFANNAYANALPNTTPQPTNVTAPTNTTPTNFGGGSVPSNLPAPANNSNYNLPAPANDLDYGKKTSTFGKIAGNLKKIARPDALTVAVGVGLAVTDYLLDPSNNRPQPKEEEQPQPQPAPQPQQQTGCQVGFGDYKNPLPLSEFIAKINARTEYSGSSGYKFEVTSESVAKLSQREQYYKQYYDSRNMSLYRLNAENNTVRVKFTHLETGIVSHNDYSASIYVTCPEPAPKEEENPQEEPQPRPQEQPQPRPQEQPQPQPAPQPRPQEQPQPRPQEQPQPQPAPQPRPQEQPQPQDEYELNLEFELPQFCDWAKPVCDFIDWFKKDDNSDDTEIDIPEQTIQPVDTNIKFKGQCPNDIVYNVSFGGKEFTFFNFQWSKFCEFLSYLKYVIIGMASLGAIKIVGGVNVND